MSNTGKKRERENIFNNKIKPILDPSSIHQTSTQVPISDKFPGEGGGGWVVRTPAPPPLLWIRACVFYLLIYYFIYLFDSQSSDMESI